MKCIVKDDIEKKDVFGDYLFLQVKGERDIDTLELHEGTKVLKFPKSLKIPTNRAEYKIEYEESNGEVRDFLLKREIRQYKQKSKQKVEYKTISVDKATLEKYRELLELGVSESVQDAFRAMVEVINPDDLKRVYTLYKARKEQEKMNKEPEPREFTKRYETTQEAIKRAARA